MRIKFKLQDYLWYADKASFYRHSNTIFYNKNQKFSLPLVTIYFQITKRAIIKI